MLEEPWGRRAKEIGLIKPDKFTQIPKFIPNCFFKAVSLYSWKEEIKAKRKPFQTPFDKQPYANNDNNWKPLWISKPYVRYYANLFIYFYYKPYMVGFIIKLILQMKKLSHREAQ